MDEQKLISIPWAVIPALDGQSVGRLFVSVPDSGTSTKVLEFGISEKAANSIEAMIENPELWNSFFSSLINSIEIANV